MKVMPTLSRRELLKYASAASLALSARARGQSQPSLAPYPTIFIHLFGGVDQFMFFDARPGLPNRDVQASNVRVTRAGVRWNTATLDPYLTAHMEDAVLIRNLTAFGDHVRSSTELLYGQLPSEPSGLRSSCKPWMNVLASQLNARVKVPLPNVAKYYSLAPSVGAVEPLNLVSWNNVSLDPLCAVRRVQNLVDFAKSLDVSASVAEVARRQAAYRLSASLDPLFSPQQQHRLLDLYGQSLQQADAALASTAAVKTFWPPAASTSTAFNLGAGDLAQTNLPNGQPGIKAMLAAAFEMARLQLTHVVFVMKCENGDYDSSHDENINTQHTVSKPDFEAIGQLLSALKATPSPVEPGQSMFDTTHVVVTSEIIRNPSNSDAGGGVKAAGTSHWPGNQAVCFGGRFRRGLLFGDLGPNYMGLSTDFATGTIGQGSVPTPNDLIATLFRANGVDSALWSAKGKPLTAVLRSP
ncbi:MAG: DUF1501 domain-containing protein [Myxococcaceae bacterium]|nr:DUF1501 domain-containing protein [Myxococcaceae bacterium]